MFVRASSSVGATSQQMSLAACQPGWRSAIRLIVSGSREGATIVVSPYSDSGVPGTDQGGPGFLSVGGSGLVGVARLEGGYDFGELAGMARSGQDVAQFPSAYGGRRHADDLGDLALS
jgi:hypothetical protein